MAVWMGLDFGQKRIGVAVSDETGKIALPLLTLERKGRQQLIRDLTRLTEDYRVSGVVVGLPMALSGHLGLSAQAVMAEVDALREHFRQPWVLWDERLSTAEVERVLLEADVSRAKRREVRDRLAAQRILQNYMDHQSAIAARGH